MSGLGGLNRSPAGVVLGMVQLQLPTVTTPNQLAQQTSRIVELVGKARRNLPSMDLVVFPEYSLHGLSMSTDPALMCRLDGPEVEAFRGACEANKMWGCFSIMEQNPRGNPYNSGIILDDRGELRLYYRKLHPWVPVEPWEPGDVGIPVCDGPNGSRLALIICHDGMFPEMARECAYKGAEIITAEVRPDLVREARRTWGVENNIYQLGHRGYVAVKGGAGDCPYTFMRDLVGGQYHLPWEDQVVHVDGTSCGFPPPERRHGGPALTLTPAMKRPA